LVSVSHQTSEATLEKHGYTNHKSVATNPEIVSAKLAKEIALNRMAGPFHQPPLNNMVVSPIGLVPKKDSGEFRLIHDLSFPKGNSVNSNIDPFDSAVQYETLDHCVDILQKLGKNALMAKADLQDAFRNMPVHTDDHRFLGFIHQGKYFYDKCLPFGCSSSCQTFECLSTALQWICSHRYNVQHVSHILDDFIFFSPQGSDTCKKSLHTFMALCQHVGLPIKQSKTVWPSTRVQLHGIEVDTSTMHLRLPPDKLADLKSKVDSMWRLIALTTGLAKPYHMIRLTVDARRDLAAWHLFLRSFSGSLFCLPTSWSSSEVQQLQSDASGFAYAAVLGARWLQGKFPSELVRGQHRCQGTSPHSASHQEMGSHTGKL
jgi:hypothetical protein